MKTLREVMAAMGAPAQTIEGAERLLRERGPEAVIAWQLQTVEAVAGQVLSGELSPAETAKNLGSLLSTTGAILSALGEVVEAEQAVFSIVGMN